MKSDHSKNANFANSVLSTMSDIISLRPEKMELSKKKKGREMVNVWFNCEQAVDIMGSRDGGIFIYPY